MDDIFLNDSTLLGYSTALVLCIYISVLLVYRWQRRGLCPEKKVLLLMVGAFSVRFLAAVKMRLAFLSQDADFKQQLVSWWWTMGTWLPVFALAIVSFYISYNVGSEEVKEVRDKKNGEGCQHNSY